jgi:long-chain fatty acid transport protein
VSRRGAALVALLLMHAPARANPIDAFGFGSRAPAMGGAVTASSEDASANYYNPAGLVRGTAMRIDIGYRYAQPVLKLNSRDVGVDASRGFAIGIAAPGHIGPFRFAFGAALWLPDQRLTRVRSLPYDQPRFIYYDNRMQRLLLQTNLAIQIVPGLYIGGGLTFMSKTQGELFLRGTVSLGDPDTSSLVTKIDVDLVAIRYPQAGILWDITPTVSVGVTYRHSFRLDLDQQFRIDGNVGDPPVVSNGYFYARSISNDLFQPWQLTAGAQVRLTRRFLLTYDLTFAHWSDMPVPAPSLTIGLDIGQFNDRVHLPGPRVYSQPYFHDIVIPRIGGEWRALQRNRIQLDLRAGYSYEPTPAPEQIFDSSFADCDKHTFSAGLGIDLPRLQPILALPLSIDFHFALTILPPRANHKVDPLDRTGDFVAGGTVPQLGVMLRSRF